MNMFKKTGGFTLVELIVVIAILAILAGVAVPAYSGYLAKANEAADSQLLGALNTAFAAACAENGVDITALNATTADMPLDEDGKVDLENVKPADIQESFEKFFAGNTDSAFKVYEELYFDAVNHCFSVNEDVVYNFNGQQITLSAKDVAILSGDNAFSDRGSDALLNDVGVLQTYLAGGFIGSEILDDVGESEEFYFAMGGYLGLNRENYVDDNAYMDAIGAEIDRLKVDNPNVATNALIMYSASHAANATKEQIDKLFTGTVTGNIAVTKKDDAGNTVRDNEATMANAALAYGMYTAYVQRNNLDTTVQGNDFVNVVTSDEFEKYIQEAEGKADLEAYMAAMNMISNNTTNSDVTGSILANGIVDNEELAKLMKDVMGN